MNKSLNNTNDLINNTSTSVNMEDNSESLDVMYLLSNSISSVGVIANIIVIIAFLNHGKLRKKIPNIFIINQVSWHSFGLKYVSTTFFSVRKEFDSGCGFELWHPHLCWLW